MTQSSKSPARNFQCPPSPQLRPYQPNCVQSWSNFQDMLLSNYQHNFQGSTWPNPSSIQSGTINIFKPPCNQNLFLSRSLAKLSLLYTFKQQQTSQRLETSRGRERGSSTTFCWPRPASPRTRCWVLRSWQTVTSPASSGRRGSSKRRITGQCWGG